MHKSNLLLFISIVLFLPFNNLVAQRITVPNKEFFKVVKTLLDEGYAVKIPIKGKSMRPIIMDYDCVTVQKTDTVSLYDIVLAEVSQERYILHRVVDICGEDITLMGDGNPFGTEMCKREDIIARAVSLFVDEREYQLGSSLERQWAMTWNKAISERDSLLHSVTREQLIKEILPIKAGETCTQSSEQFDADGKYVISTYRTSTFDCTIVYTENPQGVISLNSGISMNSTASFLLNEMRGREFDAEDMAKALCAAYDVGYLTAYDDSVRLLREWYRVGLVRKVKL